MKTMKNKSLRSRTIVGINVLSEDFLLDDMAEKFKDGKVYDPRMGREFKANIYLKEDGNLKVEQRMRSIYM